MEGGGYRLVVYGFSAGTLQASGYALINRFTPPGDKLGQYEIILSIDSATRHTTSSSRGASVSPDRWKRRWLRAIL